MNKQDFSKPQKTIKKGFLVLPRESPSGKILHQYQLMTLPIYH